MDNCKSNEYYINKILENIDFIIFHTDKLTITKFKKNEILQDSMMFRLVQISENAGHISSDFKNRYSNIPWNDISGLRNRIVHDYGNVDFQIIFDTLIKDIPNLKILFLQIQ